VLDHLRGTQRPRAYLSPVPVPNDRNHGPYLASLSALHISQYLARLRNVCASGTVKDQLLLQAVGESNQVWIARDSTALPVSRSVGPEQYLCHHPTNSRRFQSTIALLCALLRVGGACNVRKAVRPYGVTQRKSAIADVVRVVFYFVVYKTASCIKSGKCKDRDRTAPSASSASPDCPMRAWHRVQSHQLHSPLAGDAPYNLRLIKSSYGGPTYSHDGHWQTAHEFSHQHTT
jgi:hypothetical protein